MRVLLGVDGSDGSNDAARLVRAMAWPPDTTVHPVSVVAYTQDLRDASVEAREIVEEAAAGLQNAGRSPSAEVRHGQVPARSSMRPKLQGRTWWSSAVAAGAA